jgi:hypothetical protein
MSEPVSLNQDRLTAWGASIYVPISVSETQDVMKVILDLMEAVDGTHYQGMVKLMVPVEADV